uniref:Uncharacterized protein n=1 Tax=Rhizophagus irregularis (strain DAOM 181602 / DAOM 197198 / MUCL 43194) TaxID=747089 RepID=U9T241_RHIID
MVKSCVYLYDIKMDKLIKICCKEKDQKIYILEISHFISLLVSFFNFLVSFIFGPCNFVLDKPAEPILLINDNRRGDFFRVENNLDNNLFRSNTHRFKISVLSKS